MSLAYAFDPNDPRDALYECSLSLSLLSSAFSGNTSVEMDDAAVTGLIVQFRAIQEVVDASYDVISQLIRHAEGGTAERAPAPAAPRLTRRRPAPAAAAAA